MNDATQVTRSRRPLLDQLVSWWFSPQPRARVAVLRTAVYGFIFVDVFLTTSWVAHHGELPGELYHPLFLARLLHLPAPTAMLVRAVEIGLLLFAGLAAWGKAPRITGVAVFLLYLEWMLIAFSYGKVDHDRFAFLVALAVLPTVGRVRSDDRNEDEASGWALRAIQVAVVLTYFLAAFAKLRFGGLEWLNGATLARAVLRRGTVLSEPLLEFPWVLVALQYVIVAFELASPLLFAPGRLGRLYLKAAFVFHAVTYAGITIVFLPHVVCLLSFLPLERITWRGHPLGPAAAPAVRSARRSWSP